MRAVTDEEGHVVARHDFEPFGEEWFGAAGGPGANPVDKRLFTGKERDAELELDYFGARYYRSDIGRFTTVDPAQTISENLVDPQRWNRYAYVRNNPLRYTDPDGRDLKRARAADVAGEVGAARAHLPEGVSQSTDPGDREANGEAL